MKAKRGKKADETKLAETETPPAVALKPAPASGEVTFTSQPVVQPTP